MMISNCFHWPGRCRSTWHGQGPCFYVSESSDAECREPCRSGHPPVFSSNWYDDPPYESDVEHGRSGTANASGNKSSSSSKHHRLFSRAARKTRQQQCRGAGAGGAAAPVGQSCTSGVAPSRGGCRGRRGSPGGDAAASRGLLSPHSPREDAGDSLAANSLGAGTAAEPGHGSTSDDCSVQTSDDESQDIVNRKLDHRLGVSGGLGGRASNLVGRVRDLRNDVKKKISKFRAAARLESESSDTCEMGLHQSISSMESESASSLHATTASSSNRSSASTEEEVGAGATAPLLAAPPVGPHIGRAKALVDYTPSPYDKHALKFNKGDIIDVLSMSPTGIWQGILNDRVGHFKFINVELLPKSRQRHNYATGGAGGELNAFPASGQKPRSVEVLLQYIHMEAYLSVFVLNGYEDLDLFRELEEGDLDYLGITELEHRQKIMMAVEFLQDCCDGTILDCPPASSSSTTALSDRSPAEASRHDNSPLHRHDSSSSGFAQSESAGDCLSGATVPPNLSNNLDQVAVQHHRHTTTNAPEVEPRRHSTEQQQQQQHRPRQTAHGVGAVSSSLQSRDGAVFAFNIPPSVASSPETDPRCRSPTCDADTFAGSAAGGSPVYCPSWSNSSWMKRQHLRECDSPESRRGRSCARGTGSPRLQEIGNKKLARLRNSEPPESVCPKVEARVATKLTAEGIDLTTGECNGAVIVKSLVQRYSEELNLDTPDVACALERVRVMQLHRRNRIGISNQSNQSFAPTSSGGNTDCSSPSASPTTQMTDAPTAAGSQPDDGRAVAVGDWLESIGMSPYAARFRQAGFGNAAQLATMTPAEVERCGVHNERDRRTLVDALKVLQFNLSRRRNNLQTM